MKIDVTEVTDEGVVTLDLDDEATQFLIETGFNSILSNAVEEWKTKLKPKVDSHEFWEHYCRIKKDVMSFEKGSSCDWCEMTEVESRNEEQIKKLKQYEEWRRDES
jgi:hypothetical protein